jgi:hypothetical protein
VHRCPARTGRGGDVTGADGTPWIMSALLKCLRVLRAGYELNIRRVTAQSIAVENVMGKVNLSIAWSTQF